MQQMLTTLTKVFCALFGHSHINKGCMGYIHCARCGELLGDTLAGCYRDSLQVMVDHNCPTCFANYDKLSWRDKFLVPFPFKKNEMGVVGVITDEERRQEFDRLLESWKASLDERMMAEPRRGDET